MNGSGSLDGTDRDEEFLDPRALALLDNWCDAVQDALDGDEVAYAGARDRVPAWAVLLAACSLLRRTEAAYLRTGALEQIVRALPRLETLATDEGRWPRDLREMHRALDAQAVETVGERLRPGPIRAAPGPDPAAERLLAVADRIDLLVLASCELAIRDAARRPDREDLSPDAAALLEAAVTTALRFAWNSPELPSLQEWYLAHGEMLSATARALARPMRPGRENSLAAAPDRRALGLAASPIISAITCLDAARENEEEEGFTLRIAVESIRDIAEIPADSLASITESQPAADVLRSFRALPEMPSTRPWAGTSRGVGGTVIQTAMRMVLPRLAAAASTEIEPPSPVFRWSPPGQEGFATWLASPSASDGRIVLRFFDASGSLSGRWAGRTVRWLGATATVEESRAIFDALELAREHTLEGIVEGADELTVDDERWSVGPHDSITE